MAAIRQALSSDFEAATALLRRSGLPVNGLADHFSRALVAEDDGAVIGCVALEMYGEVALLRSLAVEEGRRGERLGERLSAAALAAAKAAGVRDVYLLTQTAEKFFPRFGFAVEERALAPQVLSRSEEFRGNCCPTAVLMRAKVSA
ncbi:MAG TPA: arsenic resistance N-acetyltransferase ArsN2 [Thermoanaerobaculia bacterium]|nr:arsenic resistance N-acetyltransferase ArsN2 [Thermoanaerobaculia bacterium]